MKWPTLPPVSGTDALVLLGLAGLFASLLPYSLALAGVIVSAIVLLMGLVGAYRE